MVQAIARRAFGWLLRRQPRTYLLLRPALDDSRHPIRHRLVLQAGHHARVDVHCQADPSGAQEDSQMVSRKIINLGIRPSRVSRGL